MTIQELAGRGAGRGDDASADIVPFERRLDLDVEAAKFLRSVACTIQYAFQPIVSMHSGRCHAVEALMRNWQALGFDSIDALLDYAHDRGVLAQTDAELRRIAFRQFRRIGHADEIRLFFNLDNRLFTNRQYRPESILAMAREFRVTPSAVVLEVSERGDLHRSPETYQVLNTYRGSAIQIAIDDFGTGYSGLALLYDTHPDYIKIDRYFIANVGEDPKKKVFVSHVVSLAKTLGIRVIAEGVETEQEFHICRDMGCDLVQGYLLQPPTVALEPLRPFYEIVPRLKESDRRSPSSETRMLADQLDAAPALHARMRMPEIFEAFCQHPERSFFPFLSDNGEPVGIIRETELKQYIYSRFGRELLQRRSIEDCLGEFLRRCPIADIHSSMDMILEQYTASDCREGVIITEDGRYRGLLSADALLLALHERNLQQARDENPLTRLPGNPSIERFIAASLGKTAGSTVFIHLDLDNFKVFNDAYGFRRGDRVLLLFAHLLRKQLREFDAFVGHVGGDDFFAGIDDAEFPRVHAAVEALIQRFRADVVGLYDEAHRQAGSLMGADRQGRRRCFDLLTACAAIVEVAPQSRWRSEYPISTLIVRLKHEAKCAGGCVVAATLA
jgi:diguanylate cyclase (GGDEF)-like protein